MRRLLVPALLASLAACGGSSRLSATAYRAKLATIAKEADKAQTNVEQAMNAKTVAAIGARLSTFATADDHLGDEIAALKPPKEADQANTALARAEHDTAHAVRSLLPHVAKAKTPTAAVNLLQRDEQAAKAGQELDAALTRLKQLGYTKGS